MSERASVMGLVPIDRVVAEELEADPDLGSSADRTAEFAVEVGDQPIAVRLRSVFEQLGKPAPPELALYNMFEIWLVPHRLSLVRRRGFAEPTAVGLEIEYIRDNTTCSIISLVPTPQMITHGQVQIGLGLNGKVSATGEFAPALGVALNPILNVGSLGFGVSGDGAIGFHYKATVATPVITAVGVGSSKCEWRFDRHDEPLFGRTIETWSAVALPKRQRSLAYRARFYYLTRTLFFPTRRESEFSTITCTLANKLLPA